MGTPPHLLFLSGHCLVLGPPIASLYLNHLFEDPVSKHGCVLRSWVQGINMGIGRSGFSSSPITSCNSGSSVQLWVHPPWGKDSSLQNPHSSSRIHSSQEVGATRASTDRWIDTQNVVCTPNGVWLSRKRRKATLQYSTMWIKLEDIILSERSQLQIKTRKTAECFHLHGAPRGVTFIETESRVVPGTGRGGWGVSVFVWFGIVLGAPVPYSSSQARG